MSRLPLDRLGLAPSSHLSALSWLALLYHKPREFEKAAERLSLSHATRLYLCFYAHTLPYLVAISAMGRWVCFEVLKLETDQWFSGSLQAHSEALVIGLVAGPVAGLGFGSGRGLVARPGAGLVGGIGGGLGVGIGVGIGFGIVIGLGLGLGVGIGVGIVIGIVIGIGLGIGGAPGGGIGVEIGAGIGLGIGLGIFFGIGVGIGVGIGFGIGVGIGFGLGWCLGLLRLYYLPLHFYLIWPSPKHSLYSYHPAAWDDCCHLEFPGLHRLLVAHAELDGESEIERILDTYPAQRGQALRARTILIARKAAQLDDLAQLDGILAALPEGKKGYLSQTAELRYKVHEVAELQARIKTLERPLLAEPFAELLVKTLVALESQIAGFYEPLATEFRRAVKTWKKLALEQLSRKRAATSPTRQVFRAGEAVNRDLEAFLFRGGPAGELEQQIMLATGCPGLVIYGRRRMGKSTLIRNLSGFLPPKVHVIDLSMHSPRAFESMGAWISLLEESLTRVVQAPVEGASDLLGLERLLNRVDSRLAEADQSILLAIDEYEKIDQKIGEGVFSKDLLAAVRESIQSHRQITWAFVGGHRIDELNAPWTSYLVSARTVEIGPFNPEETHLLLTQPMKHSRLWRDEEEKRPSFEPGFWGSQGIEHIHAETGGWPHLVQLVAETTVDQLNDSSQSQVDGPLLERSLSKTPTAGDTAFRQLLVDESHLEGELSYLRAFADQETQPPPPEEALRRSLKRRLLVIEDGGLWRLRAPLMARWLRDRL